MRALPCTAGKVRPRQDREKLERKGRKKRELTSSLFPRRTDTLNTVPGPLAPPSPSSSSSHSPPVPPAPGLVAPPGSPDKAPAPASHAPSGPVSPQGALLCCTGPSGSAAAPPPLASCLHGEAGRRVEKEDESVWQWEGVLRSVSLSELARVCRERNTQSAGDSVIRHSWGRGV